MSANMSDSSTWVFAITTTPATTTPPTTTCSWFLFFECYQQLEALNIVFAKVDNKEVIDHGSMEPKGNENLRRKTKSRETNRTISLSLCLSLSLSLSLSVSLSLCLSVSLSLCLSHRWTHTWTNTRTKWYWFAAFKLLLQMRRNSILETIREKLLVSNGVFYPSHGVHHLRSNKNKSHKPVSWPLITFLGIKIYFCID